MIFGLASLAVGNPALAQGLLVVPLQLIRQQDLISLGRTRNRLIGWLLAGSESWSVIRQQWKVC